MRLISQLRCPSATKQMCGCSPYKVLRLQVYDMQLLRDTHIYQEGSISPPCMVLLQSEQQEGSACVVLVNGEVMCSQEDLQGSKSQPLSSRRAQHSAEVRLYQVCSYNIANRNSFLSACVKVKPVRQSVRKSMLKTQQLSLYIFKAEGSCLWM